MPVCRYEYDAFGGTTVRDIFGNVIDPTTGHIGNINPFRWKSHYYDAETKWYYIDGRYYDPAIYAYVTVDKPENLLENAGLIYACCRYLIAVNNAVSLPAMIATIFTVQALAVDMEFYRDHSVREIMDHYNPLKQALGRVTEWINGLDKWVRILIGVILIAIAVAITVATHGAALKLLLGVLIGVLTSMAASGLAAVDNGESFASGAVEGFATGLMMAGITAVVIAAYSAISGAIKAARAANAAKAQPTAGEANPAANQAQQQPQFCNYYLNQSSAALKG
jgi:RHS repeat-associated protein